MLFVGRRKTFHIRFPQYSHFFPKLRENTVGEKHPIGLFQAVTSQRPCWKDFLLQPSDFTKKHHVTPYTQASQKKKITNILKLKQNPQQWMAPLPQHRVDIISCVAACTRWGLELFGIPLPCQVWWQDLALLLLLSLMVPPLGVSSRV